MTIEFILYPLIGIVSGFLAGFFGVGGGLVDTFSQGLESVHVNHSRGHCHNNAENCRGEPEQ